MTTKYTLEKLKGKELQELIKELDELGQKYVFAKLLEEENKANLKRLDFRNKIWIPESQVTQSITELKEDLDVIMFKIKDLRYTRSERLLQTWSLLNKLNSKFVEVKG